MKIKFMGGAKIYTYSICSEYCNPKQVKNPLRGLSLHLYMLCFVSCSHYIYSLHLLWDVAGLYSWWSPICPMVHAMNHWIWCTQCVAIEVTKDTNNKKSIIVMAASKQFLSYHLFESHWNLEGYYLVGSSLEVVMDKFTTLASLNCRNFVVGSKWFVHSGMGTMTTLWWLLSEVATKKGIYMLLEWGATCSL